MHGVVSFHNPTCQRDLFPFLFRSYFPAIIMKVLFPVFSIICSRCLAEYISLTYCQFTVLNQTNNCRWWSPIKTPCWHRSRSSNVDFCYLAFPTNSQASDETMMTLNESSKATGNSITVHAYIFNITQYRRNSPCGFTSCISFRSAKMRDKKRAFQSFSLTFLNNTSVIWLLLAYASVPVHAVCYVRGVDE